MKINVEKFFAFEEQIKPIVVDSRNNLLKLVQKENFSNIEKLLNREDVLETPASPRVYYHNGFKGGWVLHTRNVVKIISLLYNSYKQSLETFPTINNAKMENDVNLSSLLKVAILHDIGKLDNYYKRNDWYGISNGRSYITNPDMTFIQHSKRGLMLCNKYNIILNESEMEAILLHDGPSANQFSAIFPDVGIMTLLVYEADMLATKLEKEQFDKFVFPNIKYEFIEEESNNKKIEKTVSEKIVSDDVISDLNSSNDDYSIEDLL